MDDLEERQSIVRTISYADFERIFLEMENHFACLVELLAIGANVNENQRQQNEVGGPDSSSSSN